MIATSTVLRLVLLALAAGLADGCSSSAQNTTVGADGGSANDLSAPSGDLAADPAAVTFAVPTGGGAVDVVGTSQSYAFEFPANVAGQKFTITPIAAAAAGGQQYCWISMQESRSTHKVWTLPRLSGVSMFPLIT